VDLQETASAPSIHPEKTPGPFLALSDPAPLFSGWLYLAVVIDLYSRLVVGWSMKDRPNQELVNEALMMAVEQRRPAPGLIHHSDQGILYASTLYRQLLSRYGMIQSMSRSGTPPCPLTNHPVPDIA
jgi:transposase InsO family protein